MITVGVASVNGTDGSSTVPERTIFLLGTVMCRITSTVDLVTISGSPTGGTFTISVTAGGSTQKHVHKKAGAPSCSFPFGNAVGKRARRSPVKKIIGNPRYQV